jgi:hypothetical protein
VKGVHPGPARSCRQFIDKSILPFIDMSILPRSPSGPALRVIHQKSDLRRAVGVPVRVAPEVPAEGWFGASAGLPAGRVSAQLAQLGASAFQKPGQMSACASTGSDRSAH